MRRAAGLLAVAILKGIARLPIPLVLACGIPLIPVYLALRPRMWKRLRKAAPTSRQAPAFPVRYYGMRLRLVLLSLRHLRGLPDGCTHVVENTDLYHAALRTGKPVVLLGWHQGPVELLHRIPHAAPEAANRFKVLMTAGAFAPALAGFLYAGRAVDGKLIARPGDKTALRRWERERGILAVMVDQVPGLPDAWSELESGLEIPWPRRLMEWLEARDPVFLAVSVRWEAGDRILFRFDDIAPCASSSSSLAHDPEGRNALRDRLGPVMSESLRRAPEQYNWSYGKIGVAR